MQICFFGRGPCATLCALGFETLCPLALRPCASHLVPYLVPPNAQAADLTKSMILELGHDQRKSMGPGQDRHGSSLMNTSSRTDSSTHVIKFLECSEPKTCCGAQPVDIFWPPCATLCAKLVPPCARSLCALPCAMLPCAKRGGGPTRQGHKVLIKTGRHIHFRKKWPGSPAKKSCQRN